MFKFNAYDKIVKEKKEKRENMEIEEIYTYINLHLKEDFGIGMEFTANC